MRHNTDATLYQPCVRSFVEGRPLLVSENGIDGPFAYVVLLKDGTTYKAFGQYANATEAFEDRRLLCEQHGTRSFFLRAVRVRPVEVVGPNHPDSREDRWRDALATCDETLISPEELPEFRQWSSREIENRPAYQRTDRETPRFVERHGEIPF